MNVGDHVKKFGYKSHWWRRGIVVGIEEAGGKHQLLTVEFCDNGEQEIFSESELERDKSWAFHIPNIHDNWTETHHYLIAVENVKVKVGCRGGWEGYCGGLIECRQLNESFWEGLTLEGFRVQGKNEWVLARYPLPTPEQWYFMGFD